MSAPELTIVLPVRNREKLLPHTLGPIAAQHFRPLNVVLVDNGSTDGTLHVLHEWKKRCEADNFKIKILQEPRTGACIARNRGLAEVDTEYVMFFDSDDTMESTHVGNAMEYLSAHPDTDILGWDVRYHFGAKSRIKRFSLRHKLYHCIMHGSMATLRYLCRTRLMREAGAWNENVPYWNDIELGTRLLTKFPNAHIAKLRNKPTVHVMVGSDSITGLRFSDRRDQALTAVSHMQKTIGADNKKIIDLKLAILAGDMYMEGEKSMAKEMMATVMTGVDDSWHRLVLEGVYRYKRLGGRGAARIVQYLI